MDLWVGHAYRRRSCINCTKGIELGDRVAIGQWKRTYPWGTRTRRVMSHWECWLTLQEVYFDDHPYDTSKNYVPGPGRKAKYNKEQKKQRLLMHAQVWRWKKKQQAYIGQGLWETADRYRDQIREVRVQLDNMGNEE